MSKDIQATVMANQVREEAVEVLEDDGKDASKSGSIYWNLMSRTFKKLLPTTNDETTCIS